MAFPDMGKVTLYIPYGRINAAKLNMNTYPGRTIHKIPGNSYRPKYLDISA